MERIEIVNPERIVWCCEDRGVTLDDLAMGVWGREARRMDSNNLNVLLHRLRREILDVGFDPSFLERRNHAVRVRLVHVFRS